MKTEVIVLEIFGQPLHGNTSLCSCAAMFIAKFSNARGVQAAQGKRVRGLVFINPGNPTGQCLTEDNLRDLIKFAVDNEIVLMADEVYQPNIYQDEKPFVSAR
jgi:aspartate/methionine/tyrosine aminotransferase